MSEVKLEGLSVNMDYMFTIKGVLKMSYDLKDLNGRNYVPYTYEHLNFYDTFEEAEKAGLDKKNQIALVKLALIDNSKYCKS